MRTPETVFHPDTIASLTGAPITLGHPEDLKPANWRDHVVGNISGVPQRVGDNLEADVLIGDQRGIDALDEGIDEVSVGYTFGLLRADGDVGYQYKTDGAMTVQHSAIVPAGRAGPNIRIYDRRGDAMTPEDRKQIVDELKDSLVKELKGGDASPDAVAAAVERGMKPLTDRMDKFEKDAADAATAKAEDERKQADEARANQLIADTVAIERKRAAVFDAALTAHRRVEARGAARRQHPRATSSKPPWATASRTSRTRATTTCAASST